MHKRRPSGDCQKCGTWRLSLHREHIVPKFKGGTEAPENIQYICANCHEDKTREDLRGRYVAPHSAETRQKISDAGKGRKASPETLAIMRQAHIGRHTSTPEIRAKISTTKRSRLESYDSRENIRAAARKREATRTPEERSAIAAHMRTGLKRSENVSE